MRAVSVLLLVAAACAADQMPVNLCGRQLADAREWICELHNDKLRSEYVYGEIFKRGPMHNTLDDLMYEGKAPLGRPWSGRRGALSADWTRYKRGGIVDECCLKPCTTDVILNYC